MITLELQNLFVWYLAVFLALVAAAWLLLIRRRRRWERRARRIFVCAVCRADLPEVGQARQVRCEQCGARQLKSLWKDAAPQS